MFVDLFAGCGGLSLGLLRAGWRLSFAVEAHADPFSTYKANLIDSGRFDVAWPEWLSCEAHDLVETISTRAHEFGTLAGKVDLVVGGPPCQGFSTNGRRQASDPRNQMVVSYLKAIQLLSPKLVMLENVRGFTSMEHDQAGTFSEFVLRELERLGYDTWSSLLTGADWGVPQRRPRFFLVAARRGVLQGVHPFERLRTLRPAFLAARKLPTDRPVTAREALDDLRTAERPLVDDPEFGDQGFKSLERLRQDDITSFARLVRDGAGETPTDMRLPNHSTEVTDRFRRILATCPAGRSISPADRARLGIRKRSTTPMSPDLPSPTVTTLPDDIIHYAEPRILTVREHARLQTFPDWFEFKGPYTSGGPGRKLACPRYTQVGNAVPPLLAQALAEMLAGLCAPLVGEQRAERLEVGKVTGEVPPQPGESVVADRRVAA